MFLLYLKKNQNFSGNKVSSKNAYLYMDKLRQKTVDNRRSTAWKVGVK